MNRAVFVSTTAILQLNAGSKTVRQAAEAAILASGLETTILRPTMIYGLQAIATGFVWYGLIAASSAGIW